MREVMDCMANRHHEDQSSKNKESVIRALTLGPLSSKKGQEEIVGFLLIVIMIIVIGLALLFFFKPKQEEARDFQAENLLYSIMATTYNGQDISSRLGDCERGIGCKGLGEGMDKILNAALSKSGLVVGQSIQGYSLNISGNVDYYVLKGRISSSSRGAATISGNNMVRLKFYS